ncbi:SoxR reducing system RseC family protein [Beggiatoa alba]|nr:SoxR reducing system RseC family protein [Beggiatoa alba]
MIEQTAKVLSTENDAVLIEVKRQTACGACSAKKGCGKSLLDNVFKIKPLIFSLPNTLGARENDQVIVGLNESALLQASFYLYFVPLLSMIVAALLADYFFVNQYLEVITIIAAIVGLYTGSRYSRYILEKKGKNQSAIFQPVLIKILPRIISPQNNIPEIEIVTS